jgi:hypothetical protein
MSTQSQRTTATAHGRSGAEDEARAARTRRNGWLLGAFAIVFYLGYIAWNVGRAL